MKSSVIKICNICHKVLSEDDFYWKNKKKTYRSSCCKKCQRNQDILWREDNKDYQKHHDKKYLITNRAKVYAKNAKRRAKKKNQSPDLTDSEKKKLLLYYKISEFMGEDWNVDHIKPISKGGLHHPDNLQVIPAHHNLCKNNNEDYVIPEELIIRI